MIEKTLLIENVGSVLVTLNSKGEMHWVGAPEETLRQIVEHSNYPSLQWYRCSGWDVHAAANGTPKYRAGEALHGARGWQAERVRRFVERLNGVPA